MRIRAVCCPECGWVLASACSHWSLDDCPRAKKKGKARHKLVMNTPGYDVFVVKPDHDYVPDPAPWPESYLKSLAGWNWFDVPSQMRYSNCLICELPWHYHLAGHEGDMRYVGMWSRGPDMPDGSTPAFIQSPAPGTLIECATGCGFLAST